MEILSKLLSKFQGTFKKGIRIGKGLIKYNNGAITEVFIEIIGKLQQ